MKKRILSIVLAICMVLTIVPITAFAADSYDLYVGDVGFKTSEINVTKTTTGGGSATLVRSTNSATLTLNGINVTYDKECMAAVESSISNLTIVLEGTNTITLTNSDMGGIYLIKNATIKGNSGSKLIINSNGNRNKGIKAEDGISLTIDNVNMTVNYSTTTGSVVGIMSGGVLNMNNTCTYKLNGTINALEGDTLGYLSESTSGTLNIGNNANVTFDGWETAIDTIGTLNLTGGNLTVSNAYDGICNKGTLNLTGGTLNSSGTRTGVLTGPDSQVKFAGTDATLTGGTAGWAYTSATATYSVTGGKVVLEGGSYAASIKYSSLASGYSVYAGSDKNNTSYIGSPTNSTFGNNKYVRIEPSTYYTLTLVNVKGATSASHIYGSDISYTAADAPTDQHFAYWEMQVNGGTAVKVGTSSTYNGKMPTGNATLKAVYEDCSGGTATCQTLAKCSVCGKGYGILAAHSFTAEVVDDKYAIKPVTCEDSGTYYKSCSVCGASSQNWNNATFTVPAHGHSYTKKVEDSYFLKSAAPNCTQYNVYWYICSYCNACAKDDPAAADKYYTGTTVGPHIYTEKIEDNAHYVAGTGTNCQSVKKYYYDCAYCDQIGTTTWDSTTYGPHDYATAWSSDETGHWHACTLCDDKADEAKHTPDREAATETDPIKCTVCDYIIAQTIEHTHKLTLVSAKPPTCTEDGNIAYYVCSVCGKLFADATGSVEITADDIVDEATGHEYEWIVDIEPTETEKGSKHEECKFCNDKKASVEIPSLGTQTEQLQRLLDAGGTVVLDKDYTISSTLNVNNAVILDLNGHVIKMIGSGSVFSIAKSSSNLTLMDSNKTAKHTEDSSLPDGGVITGGNADSGGGVYFISGSFTMEGGTIYKCSATNYGGGVYVGTNRQFTMTGGTIANCSGTGSYSYGGGVYISNVAGFIMENGTINNCSTGFVGGGVYIYLNSKFTMTGGTINNCRTPFNGSGVYVGSNGEFTMTDGTISNCSGTSSSPFGGGVYVYSGGRFTMEDGNINNCSAKDGGGVYVTDGSFTMTGGIIENCTARNRGSAVATNSTIIANGGSIHGTVGLDSNGKIETTSSYDCTVFYDEVKNSGTISSGIYYGGIQNEGSGTVTGTYYIVSFDLNGGIGSVPTQYFVNVSTAPALKPAAESTKEGYVFAGWYNGDTEYDFTQPVTENITLTAKWVLTDVSTESELREALDAGATAIKLQGDINLSSALDLSRKYITIDLNGYVISGADISINTGNGKASLTLKDSRHTATHTDSTLPLGGVVTSKISMKQSGGGYNDCVLYANGGTVTSEFNTNTNAVAIKCTSDTPTAFTGKISGYTHLYGGIYYGTIASSVTINGKKITFQNGDNTYAYEIVDSGNNTVAPISPSVKAGYQDFDGWYNGDTKYTFGSSLSEDITLTAKFGNPITYNITYDLDGGTASNPLTYNVESNDITLNNPTKAGYTFTGWSGTGLSGEDNMTITIPKGSLNDREYTAHYKDIAAPTGQISIGAKTWEEIINDITFGLFFKNTQTVTITASDNSGDAVTIEYLLSYKELSEAELASATFTAYTKAFGISPDNKYVIYVKLTDTSGNVTYISSNGIVLDATAPVITGVTDGAYYFTTQKAVVTDDNLKSVTLNGVSVGGTTVTLDGNKDEVYTIVATDKSGNSTTVTVTMKPIGSIAESIDDVNGKNVKSSDKEKIEAVKESVSEVDISNATDSEKEALNDINGRCDELLDIIDKAQKATETGNIKDAESISPDNVTKDDREALEMAKTDLEKVLEDYGSNYTDDEMAKIQSDLERINESLKVLDDVKAVEDLIEALPDTFEPDDLDTVQSIIDAKDAYNALTDYEKSLVSDDAKEKLDTLIKGITAYIFYEGSGGIWTIGQGGTLTFTANGAYSKFTGIKVDGEDVDESNYIAKSGSTIITLNADYLDTLSVGTHTLTVLYTDGDAEAEFEVKEAPKETEDTKETTKPNKNTSKKSPETGNDRETALWLALLTSCGGAIIVTGAYSKRKKRSR